MKTEKQLYQYLKTRCPEGHWQRIEQANLPDVNVRFKNVEAWLELKIGKLTWPEKKSNRLEDAFLRLRVTPGQAAWLYARQRLGGHAYLCAYIPRPLNMPVVIPGTFAPEFVGRDVPFTDIPIMFLESVETLHEEN